MHKVAVTLCMCWLILCRLQISRALPSMVTSHKCQLIFPKVSYCWWKKCCTGWYWENLPALASHRSHLVQDSLAINSMFTCSRSSTEDQTLLPNLTSLQPIQNPKWFFLNTPDTPGRNSSHLKIGLNAPKRKTFIFQPSIFKCFCCKLLVSGRVPGANLPLPPWDCLKWRSGANLSKFAHQDSWIIYLSPCMVCQKCSYKCILILI